VIWSRRRKPDKQRDRRESRHNNRPIQVKSVTRHFWTSSGRQESVAEHSWRLAAMIYLFRDQFRDYDIEKMISMTLFHDISEIKHGDIPTFNKTSNDIENERKALEEIAEEFEAQSIQEVIDDVEDFDMKRSKEAKIVNAFDKIEAVLQHNEADLSTWIELEYTLNLTYGTEECTCNPILKALRTLIQKETIDKMQKRDQGL
jgi:putative hydrolase of HD superfamily